MDIKRCCKCLMLIWSLSPFFFFYCWSSFRLLWGPHFHWLLLLLYRTCLRYTYCNNMTAQHDFFFFLQTRCTMLLLSGIYFGNLFKETDSPEIETVHCFITQILCRFVLRTVLLLLLSDHSIYRCMLFIFCCFNVSKNESVLFCHFLVLKVYILVNSWRFAHLGKRHCSIILTLIERRKYFWSLKENVLMVKVVVLMAVLFHLNNIKCNL